MEVYAIWWCTVSGAVWYLYAGVRVVVMGIDQCPPPFSLRGKHRKYPLTFSVQKNKFTGI